MEILRADLPPPPLDATVSLTTLTPFYSEDVIMTKADLLAKNSDGVTTLLYIPGSGTNVGGAGGPRLDGGPGLRASDKPWQRSLGVLSVGAAHRIRRGIRFRRTASPRLGSKERLEAAGCRGR